MSPATYHMYSMDQLKIDNEEFQQIQSIGSMEGTKNCLKFAMLSV
jgi:hypothetical protein